MFGHDDPLEEEQFVMPPLPTLAFVLHPAREQAYQCKILHIAFYGISSLYATSLVDTTTPISQLNFQKSKQRSLASLYKSSSENGDEYYLIFNEQFEKMKEIYLSDFIFKNFKVQGAIYLYTCVARGLLEKDDGIKLKYLQTSWGLDLHGPTFNQGLAGPQADILQWSQINGINTVCFIGIYSDYEIKKETVDEIFSPLNTMLGLSSKFDISKQVKAYNMKKYANKLYL